jgi:hypothetical protein
MIRIRKPLKPPARLTNEGSRKAQQHQQEYDDNPGDFDRGDAKFAFSSNIYNDSTVKAALIEGTGSATWGLEKVMEKGIQELGDPSEHPKIATETARSLILSFKPS